MNNIKERIKIFSGAQLKYIAFLSMFIDHTNKALIYPNLALVLAMIWVIDVLKEKMASLPKALWYFVSFLIVAVLCIVAMNASLDYEHHAVLIGYFCYIFHERWALGIPFCYISMFKEPWALLGFGLTLTYNGERGKQNKLVNYLFYPVHLLILGIIRMYLGI